jgi:hypothetical protein
MTVTVESPSPQTPDAGVIEEARARQRRHRGAAAAAAVAAAAILAIVFAFVGGGGGGSKPGGASVPQPRIPSQAARLSSAACVSATKTVLRGAPSKSLLSILGVLRRPATAADVVPPNLARLGAGSNAFVHYIRRTREVEGGLYYIYPAIIGGCGRHARQGIMKLDANIDLGGGAMGATGGGGASAANIEQGKDVGTGPPGSDTSSTLTMIVPDGVAKVTLRYPAGRASGYSPKISPPFTSTVTAVNNEVVVSVPRSAGGGGIHQAKITWQAADGSIIKTFSRPE